MGKLSDMFAQARHGQGGSGIGFTGKNKQAAKPRAAALVVEFTSADAAIAEAASKAGADGLLFAWDGKNASLQTLKKAIEAARTGEEKIVCGLDVTGGWESLTRERLEQLKEQGINYVVLPLSAPARLMALQVKELDMVVSVPMHEGDMYPIFIRNLTSFDSINAVRLDFGLQHHLGDLSIEDVLRYRAVREAVRYPALIHVDSGLNEADAYTLQALGVQALVIPAASSTDAMKEQAQQVRELLEKVYHEEQEGKESFGLTSKG